MIFKELPLSEAEGAILAHSQAVEAGRLKKGIRLSAADIAALKASGIRSVVAAKLGPDDIGEDEAAARIGQALLGRGLELGEAFAGRANFYAKAPGLVTFHAEAIEAINEIDEGITIATLPNMARAHHRQMVATVKIIPYAVPLDKVEKAIAYAPQAKMELHEFKSHRVDLILTSGAGLKPSLLAKGRKAVENRIKTLGSEIGAFFEVPHKKEEIKEALSKATSPIVMILTASATSDRRDIAPASIEEEGGVITRFGIPVDPGNLLFLGHRGAQKIIGLPGCVRSPALNGADWIIERLFAGLEIGDRDFAKMGVGGLLKEIPLRPQPRSLQYKKNARPKTAAILLANGLSSRMRGGDKMLEPVLENMPVLELLAREAAKAVDQLYVVVHKTQTKRREALSHLPITLIDGPAPELGMGASLSRAMRALPEDIDAVLISPSDMPELRALHFKKLVSAYSPDDGREICRAVGVSGGAGHPVLFGRRFFEALAGLEGDQGARDVIKASREYCAEIRMDDDAPIVDLDTPEDWKNWRNTQKEK